MSRSELIHNQDFENLVMISAVKIDISILRTSFNCDVTMRCNLNKQ